MNAIPLLIFFGLFASLCEAGVSYTAQADDLRCIKLAGDESICKLANDGGEYALVHQLGSMRFQWLTAYDGQSFRVKKLDTSNCLAVYDKLTCSNGIGICIWGIYFFESGKLPPSVIFSADDWSVKCIRKLRGSIRVAVPEWIEPWQVAKRTWMQIVLRPFILGDDDTLVPDAKEPVVGERYSAKFEKARNLGGNDGVVATLLMSDKGIAEPLIPARLMERKKYVVTSILNELDSNDPRVRVMLQGGQEQATVDLMTNIAGTRVAVRLGDMKTGRLFPRDYVPYKSLSTWIGREVVLATSTQVSGRDSNSKKLEILWI